MKPVADIWFGVARQDHSILRFREIHIDPYAVGDIWLVQGRDRDLVVDTGSGIRPPAPVIEAVCRKPAIAVALLAYYDHAGGWHSFGERACHEREAPRLADPSRENAELGDYLTEERLWALPEPGFSLERHRMVGSQPTMTLRDGEVLDLGNRKLEVLHVPGRTPGSMALWEAATGSLFTSDVLYDGPLYPAWPPEDVPSHVASLRRLRALPVTRVYPGHYGPFDGDRMRSLIDEQLADLTQRSP